MSSLTQSTLATTTSPGSGAVTQVHLDLAMQDFASGITSILQRAYGSEVVQAVTGTQSMANFTAEIAPIAAGIIQERISATGNPDVALGELGDSTLSLAQQLVADAIYGQHAIVAQAVQAFVDGLATLASKAAASVIASLPAVAVAAA